MTHDLFCRFIRSKRTFKGFLYLAIKIPQAITMTIFSNIASYLVSLLLGALTHLGLFKSPPDPNIYTSSSANYVLILDGSSHSLLPVTVYVVTAFIKAKVPIIPYSDFTDCHGGPEKVSCTVCLDYIDKRIGQEPVLVYLDRIYLLAEPETQVEGHSEDAVQKTKKSRIHDMEKKMLESKQILTTEMNKSWLGSFINTIIGNLKLSISSIHFRYEDLESNPGHPFAAGVTSGLQFWHKGWKTSQCSYSEAHIHSATCIWKCQVFKTAFKFIC